MFIQVLFDGSAPCDTCSICRRRCCPACSLPSPTSIICRSHTCLAIDSFARQQLSLHALAAACERITRDLLCQWVALQCKAEPQLAPLRALLLVDARHAALSAVEAKSIWQQVAAGSTRTPHDAAR